MRVVFLTHNFPHWPGDSSGSALGALARALIRRGIGVRVISTGAESGDAVLDGVPVRRICTRASFPDAIADYRSLAALVQAPIGWGPLARLWRQLRSAAQHELAAGVEIFHAHCWLPAGLAAPPGVPLVLTVHGLDGSVLTRSRTARRMARPLFHRAAVVTAVSREIGTWAQAATGKFFDPSHVHPRPLESRGIPWTRGGGGAVTFAPLVATSRVSLAIDAVAVLASYGHNFPLTVVGEGPDRKELEQHAARVGVSSLVRFPGATSADDARRYLERADVMIFSKQGDGLALAAIEALVAGVPVVACWDSGAAVDIVPQTGAGRLTLPSAEAMADSVLELQADPERLTMARLVGESWRARLSPNHAAELCEGWYRNALAR